MSFITGLILLDAPGSALNNAGRDESARTENAVATKLIRARQGAFPYVSGQAFRYWLRTTLENGTDGWRAAPIFREQKVAYTDANPLDWWDDDLFGYMRAASKRAGAEERRRADPTRAGETPTTAEITRVSPFRVSTLVSISPVTPTQDFGTMSRHDGDPVPHEHQFYRAVLKGLFSLDLRAAGTFSYRARTGYRNLDEERVNRAKGASLEHLEPEQSYRLPADERITRVSTLLRGMATIAGGAKQAIHYTDVTPAVVISTVTRGGNNPLQYLVTADPQGLPRAHTDALRELVKVWGDQMLSPLYVGWVQGFHDGQRERLHAALNDLAAEGGDVRLPHGYRAGHPKEMLEALAAELQEHGRSWLE
ncbi:MAG: type I-B CRISPR-associated protein Cas7/Cst2/DevR [Chloroflexi bacterium]|nr:type I-B CRISPR-associated protein Cas7/Cst2/DevR [Chloroflexota bacterium]